MVTVYGSSAKTEIQVRCESVLQRVTQEGLCETGGCAFIGSGGGIPGTGWLDAGDGD